jgi:hypothetical protein
LIGVLSLLGVLLITPGDVCADLMLRLDHSDTSEVDVFVIDQNFSPSGFSSQGSSFSSGSSTVDTLNGNTPTVGDLYAEQGAVGFSGPVGSFTMSITVGMSAPLLGEEGRMDLFNVSFSGGTGTIVIELWETGFETQGYPTRFHALLGGTTNGLVNIATYADDSDTPFGTEYYLAGGTYDGESVSGGIAFSSDQTRHLSDEQLTGSYSMGIRASITHTGMEVTSFNIDLQSTAVPEPSAAFLIAMAVLGLSCCRFRRRRNG